MKSAIRKEMISRRKAISHDEIAEKSARIQKLVMNLPEYRATDSIALYAAYNNEVSTDLIFNHSVRDGKVVLFPRIRPDEKKMDFIPLSRLDELESGPYGILSPPHNGIGGKPLSEIGVLVIPGVAYDVKGGRVGYGGGFYDRALGSVEKRPFIIALAYDFQILADVPVLPHDVRVDAVITESRMICCN